jgi:hypothetical protein
MPEAGGGEPDETTQSGGGARSEQPSRLTEVESTLLTLLLNDSIGKAARRLSIRPRAARRLVQSALAKVIEQGLDAWPPVPPLVPFKEVFDHLPLKLHEVEPLDRIQLRFARKYWDLDDLRALLEALDRLYDFGYWLAEAERGVPVDSGKPPSPMVARISHESPLSIELIAYLAASTTALLALMRQALGFVKYLVDHPATDDHPSAAETLGAIVPDVVRGWQEAWRKFNELGGGTTAKELPPAEPHELPPPRDESDPDESDSDESSETGGTTHDN